jgi:nucleoside diphosphate kinase
MLGETNPLATSPGTIRGDYCIDVGRYVYMFHQISKSERKK